MSDVHRIFGSEISPYSVKVRSYFRYKGIPHEWIERSNAVMDEFKKYAVLPLIPVVATPEDEGMQDSTPIIEKLEVRFPEPSIHPSDPALAFLSALIEEFGDEWGNKWMFHYRWARPADQESAAGRIARSMMPGLDAAQYEGIAGGIVDRMTSRGGFVGSNEQTAPQIESTFEEFVPQLDAHLGSRSFLFGQRPSFGDFGLWGQIYNAWTDPTCKEIIESRSSNIVPWVERMLDPKASGDFEGWDALKPTLMPILQDHVGGLFLPWTDANAKALEGGVEEYSLLLRSGTWRQSPQKYHARSLRKLRARYAEVADKSELEGILKEAGCLKWL
jgi:glutathione S-transferase